MSQEHFQKCIEVCNECIAACEHCATSCLGEDDVKMMANCIRLDRDCADLCAMAVRFMERDSQFATDVCEVCADVCQECGDECAKHQNEHCRHCAEVCHRCANECRNMTQRMARAA